MQTTDLLIRNYKSLLTHSNCNLACNTRLCYMPIYQLHFLNLAVGARCMKSTTLPAVALNVGTGHKSCGVVKYRAKSRGYGQDTQEAHRQTLHV